MVLLNKVWPWTFIFFSSYSLLGIWYQSLPITSRRTTLTSFLLPNSWSIFANFCYLSITWLYFGRLQNNFPSFSCCPFTPKFYVLVRSPFIFFSIISTQYLNFLQPLSWCSFVIKFSFISIFDRMHPIFLFFLLLLFMIFKKLYEINIIIFII